VGFIGFHLANHLLEHTASTVVLVDNLWRGRADDEFENLMLRFSDRVRLLVADLTVRSEYDQFDEDFDQVFHLAAVNGTKWFYQIPEDVLRINILSLFYMLEWIKETKQKPKLCFASSAEAYAGALDAYGELPLPTPETVPLVIADPFNPRWSYAGSKLIGEQIVIHMSKALGLPAIITRPHNFYGPREGFDHVIPELCLRIAKREDPFVLFGAEQTRTFCHISDAVSAFRLLMNGLVGDGAGACIFNIGGTEEVTIWQVAQTLFRISGWWPREIDHRPAPPGSVQRRLSDIGKIQDQTGWVPEVSLSEGLQTTFAWYTANPRVTG